MGLHFGFADHNTHNHTEALINQYKYVIEKGNIKKEMKILDAGCGVGGASLYIAKKCSADLVGVSIVNEQVEEARRNAIKAKLDKNVKFLVRDYANTGFASNTFDVVFGMESICYAVSKEAFLKEAYRLLKPGGKLVITDGYRRRETTDKVEKQLMKDFCAGWSLYDLVGVDQMTEDIKSSGFKKIVVEDMTKQITMSLDRMRRLVWWWNIGEILLGWIQSPIVESARDNAKAMKNWINGVDDGLFGYFAHVAVKPKK